MKVGEGWRVGSEQIHVINDVERNGLCSHKARDTSIRLVQRALLTRLLAKADKIRGQGWQTAKAEIEGVGSFECITAGSLGSLSQ